MNKAMYKVRSGYARCDSQRIQHREDKIRT